MEGDVAHLRPEQKQGVAARLLFSKNGFHVPMSASFGFLAERRLGLGVPGGFLLEDAT
jgi:hypothetical protein